VLSALPTTAAFEEAIDAMESAIALVFSAVYFSSYEPEQLNKPNVKVEIRTNA
jgi:hypothetical protein